jgi:hypothetical protein
LDLQSKGQELDNVTTFTVAPGGSIQAAIDKAVSGDTIDVQAGNYVNQFLTVNKSLTLQAVGGQVIMTETVSPPNGKAMIDVNGTIAINGFDISGVSVPDHNGAAIRYEGGALSLTDDYFHNNQEGLLGAPDANGSITINHSEFSTNGDGSGSTHLPSLTVTFTTLSWGTKLNQEPPTISSVITESSITTDQRVIPLTCRAAVMQQ